MRYAVWVRGDPCTYEWCVHFLGLVTEKKKKPRIFISESWRLEVQDQPVQQGWLLLRPLSLACRQPLSLCRALVFPLCESLGANPLFL